MHSHILYTWLEHEILMFLVYPKHNFLGSHNCLWVVPEAMKTSQSMYLITMNPQIFCSKIPAVSLRVIENSHFRSVDLKWEKFLTPIFYTLNRWLQSRCTRKSERKIPKVLIGKNIGNSHITSN